MKFKRLQLHVLFIFCVGEIICWPCEVDTNVLQYNEGNRSFHTVQHIYTTDDPLENKYFLKIAFVCTEDQNMQSFMYHQTSAGFLPVVTIIETQRNNIVTKNIHDVSLVENGCYGYNLTNTNNLTVQNRESSILSYPWSTEVMKVVDNINHQTTNCIQFWMLQLNTGANQKVIEINIESNGFGENINPKSFVYYVNSFIRSASNIPYTLLTNQSFSNIELKQMKQNDWLVILSNGYIISSSTEFALMESLQITDSLLPGNDVCIATNDIILDVLVVESKMFVATKFGVFQANASFSFELVLSECIKSIELIEEQQSNKKILVLLDHSQLRLYWKHSNTKEGPIGAKNANNETLIEWFKVHLHSSNIIQVQVVCIKASDENVLYALMKYQQNESLVYQLVQMKVENDNHWIYFVQSEMLYGNLHRLSITSSDICIWGNNLLCSMDGGFTFLEIIFTVSSTIESFTSLGNGKFIFTTEDKQVWFGTSNIAQAVKLQPLHEDHWIHMLYFVNSFNELKQMVYQCVDDCKIKLLDVDYQSLLSQSHMLLVLSHHYTPIKCDYLVTCSLYTFSSVEEIMPHYQECPYTEIEYFIENNNQLSRIQSLHHYRRYRYLEEFSRKLYQPGDYMLESTFATENISSSSNLNNWNYDILEFPNEISLKLDECTKIKIQVSLHEFTKFTKRDHQLEDWTFEDIQLYYYPLVLDNLSVDVLRTSDQYNFIIYFNIKICDKSKSYIQREAGSLHSVSKLSFHIIPDDVSCAISPEIKNHVSLRITHGCPSRTKVRLDLSKSKENQRHYCDEENCFHYDKVFLPVFKLTDEVTGTEIIFSGTYNVTVIGGGTASDEIRLYDGEEIYNFNMKPGATLIWAKDDGYRWLCGSSSPCGGITPTFPNTPQYFFLLQFSNREIDTSFCDYTLNFTIRLHGMPPDGLYPSLFIVLTSISIMTAFIFITFFIETKYPTCFSNLKQSLMHCKLSFCFPSQNKIDAGNSSDMLNDDKIQNWMNEIEMQDNQVDDQGDSIPMDKSTSMTLFTVKQETKC